MTELGDDMDVDSHPVLTPQRSESRLPWDTPRLRETIKAVISQTLDPIRLVVREEIRSALTYEQTMQKAPGPDPAIVILKLQEQLQQSQADRNRLSDQVDRLNEEAIQAQFAVSERDARNKKLQQVIIENSQNIAPPMDDEIVTLFNQLNHDIMKIVKKHFTKPLRISLPAPEVPEVATWKEYRLLSPENQELWVRAYIADGLYEEFFPRKRKIFGFDDKREDLMKDFELTLAKSGKVSEADMVDWRIRTVSCVQKLGLARHFRRSDELAYDTVKYLRHVGPQTVGEQKDAQEAMKAISTTALNIAILFRSNAVSYSWLQRKPLSTIPEAEREIIGSTDPSRCAELCQPWRIVFGGAVKNHYSEEDRVVLTKSELLVS